MSTAAGTRPRSLLSSTVAAYRIVAADHMHLPHLVFESRIHTPAAEAASTEGKQQNKKTLRPEKQSYRGPEQPPKAA